MNRSTWAALAAAAGLCLAFPAQAQQQPHPFTANPYHNRTVWITIYDLGKTRQLDYGCVRARGTRKWTSGNYAFGSFYYIRAELMDGEDCKGAKLCDTTVQFNPQVNMRAKNIEQDWRAMPDNTQWELKGDGGAKCYWEPVTRTELRVSSGDPIWVPPPRSTTMCTQEVRLSSPVTNFDKATAERIGTTLRNLEGSYKKTCRNCVYTPPSNMPCTNFASCPISDKLTADCQNGRQQWVPTILVTASACKPDTVWNSNGNLLCTK